MKIKVFIFLLLSFVFALIFFSQSRIGDFDPLYGTDKIEPSLKQESVSRVVKDRDREDVVTGDELDETGLTPLMQKINKDCIECALELVESGADVNIVSDRGETALTFASFSGELELVKALLDAGADPNHISNQVGISVLIEAAMTGKNEIIELLVDHDANIHHTDRHGKNALHYSAKEGFVETSRILMNYGLNPNTPDHHGQSAVDTAREFGHHQLARDMELFSD